MNPDEPAQAMPELLYTIVPADDGKHQVVSQRRQEVFCTCLTKAVAEKVASYLNRPRRGSSPEAKQT